MSDAPRHLLVDRTNPTGADDMPCACEIGHDHDDQGVER